MAVIKKLGDRVEREHDQFLRDSQRLEDRSAIPVSGAVSNPLGGEVNFENLVGRGDGTTTKQDTAINGSSKGWDADDVWDSIFSSEEAVGVQFSHLLRRIDNLRISQTSTPPQVMQTISLPPTPMISPNQAIRPSVSSRNPLGARPISSGSFNPSAFNPTSTTTLNPSVPPLQPPPSKNMFSTSTSVGGYSAPNYNLNMARSMSQSSNPNGVTQSPPIQFGSFSQPIQPMQPKQPPPPTQSSFTAPNYNISLAPNNPAPSFSSPPLQPAQPAPPPFFNAGMGVLSPSKPPQPAWGSTMANKPNSNDWGDLDPLG